MNRFRFGVFLASLCWCVASQGSTLWVKSPAAVLSLTTIPKNVSAVCPLETKLTQTVVAALQAHHVDAAGYDGAEPTAPGPQLVLKIVAVGGTGGGGWSGAKNMIVAADLSNEGKRIASLTKMRSSKGGIFGAVTGTCGILDDVSLALADDFAVWVQVQERSINLDQASAPAATTEP